MFRSNTVRTVFLLSVGTIAGFPLSAPAADDGPAIPAPPDQPAASRRPRKRQPRQKPRLKSSAKPSKTAQNNPARPSRSGNRHCTARLGFPTIQLAAGQRRRRFPDSETSCDRMEELTFLAASARSSRRPTTSESRSTRRTDPSRSMFPAVAAPPRTSTSRPAPTARRRCPEDGPASTAAGPPANSPSRPDVFRARNYPAAFRRVSRYLERDPGDRDLLQLRSLANFSLADYQAAYRDALAALAEGDCLGLGRHCVRCTVPPANTRRNTGHWKTTFLPIRGRRHRRFCSPITT